MLSRTNTDNSGKVYCFLQRIKGVSYVISIGNIGNKFAVSIVVRKLQPSSEHLTPLHPELLLLCFLSKCYKAGLIILEEDIFEIDRPKDFSLYYYYG